MSQRLFDCFTFFNETTLLEFRLRYLSDVVDQFVVVESQYTFTGEEKSFLAQETVAELPADIANKVRLIEVHEAPTGQFHPSCNWEREAYQRNAIMRGLQDVSAQDLVLISDVDEIPDAQLLNRLRNELQPNVGGLNLCMHMFYYRADNQMFNGLEPERWLQPKLVRPTHLLSPQTTRMATNHFPSTNPCGWHFSYMGSNEQINLKISRSRTRNSTRHRSAMESPSGARRTRTYSAETMHFGPTRASNCRS